MFERTNTRLLNKGVPRWRSDGHANASYFISASRAA